MAALLPLLVLLLAPLLLMVNAETFGNVTVNLPAQARRNQTVTASVRAYIVGLAPPTVGVKLLAGDVLTVENFGNVDLSLNTKRDYWYTFDGTVTPRLSARLGNNTLTWKFVRTDIWTVFGPPVQTSIVVLA
jgi:hypothetical protein